MSPLRRSMNVVAVLLTGGLVLGILPPAIGGVPETVIRTARLRAADLVPSGARDVHRADGSVELARPAWSRTLGACAPINFTMAAVTWRQEGMSEIFADLSWGEGPSADRATVLSQPEDSPDLDSPEWSATQGTPLVWTGGAECLRFRLQLPADETITAPRVVFINTSGTAHGRSVLSMIGDGMARAWGVVAGVGAPEPAAARTSKPKIIRRSRWGGPKEPECGPAYASKLKMAYVHHTAGSNKYSRSEADDIVRGIYAYHVNSRNFCDIAYNFLIDKFGRIYEGRAGGMGKPVVGAHAQGFNTGSTGVAAMGTFTSKAVPRRVVRAYKRLLAWRLDVAHVNPKGKVKMTSGGGSNTKYENGETVRLPAIAGHRHTGFTTCPGDRLFGKLGAIRRGAWKIGLPKIVNPRQSRNEVTIGENKTRIRAGLSSRLRWVVKINDEAGLRVQRWKGRAGEVDVRWNGRDGNGVPVPPGRYKITISARDGTKRARSATLSVHVSTA